MASQKQKGTVSLATLVGANLIPFAGIFLFD